MSQDLKNTKSKHGNNGNLQGSDKQTKLHQMQKPPPSSLSPSAAQQSNQISMMNHKTINSPTSPVNNPHGSASVGVGGQNQSSVLSSVLGQPPGTNSNTNNHGQTLKSNPHPSQNYKIPHQINSGSQNKSGYQACQVLQNPKSVDRIPQSQITNNNQAFQQKRRQQTSGKGQNSGDQLNQMAGGGMILPLSPKHASGGVHNTNFGSLSNNLNGPATSPTNGQVNTKDQFVKI